MSNNFGVPSILQETLDRLANPVGSANRGLEIAAFAAAQPWAVAHVSSSLDVINAFASSKAASTGRAAAAYIGVNPSWSLTSTGGQLRPWLDLHGPTRLHSDLVANVFGRTNSLEAMRDWFQSRDPRNGTTPYLAQAHSPLFEQLVRPSSTLAADNLTLGFAALDPSNRQSFFSATDAGNSLNKYFHRPDARELNLLANDKAGAGWSLGRNVGVLTGTERLTSLEALRSPWARIGHETDSVRAIGDLMTIGRNVSGGLAFQTRWAGDLRSAFGDWRDPIVEDTGWAVRAPRLAFYREQGIDPSLTDFPRAAFQEILEEAELNVRSDAPVADDGEGIGRARLQEAYERLLKLEREVRRFIDREMTSRFGDTWMKSRLPNGMLEGWRKKRESAIQAGQPSCPLIEYADFTEYKGIIERGDNWKELFRFFFGRAEDVRESFQRMFPLRIATMHGRFISNDDELLLLVESRRLMSAIAPRSG